MTMYFTQTKSVGTHNRCYQCSCGGTCKITTVMAHHEKYVYYSDVVVFCCGLVAIMVTHILQDNSTGTGEIGYLPSVKQPWGIWINRLYLSTETPKQSHQKTTKQSCVYIVWDICTLQSGIAICLSKLPNVLQRRKLFLQKKTSIQRPRLASQSESRKTAIGTQHREEIKLQQSPAKKFGPWASCQKRKISDCTSAGNAGNVFHATPGNRPCHASRHVH